MNILFFYRIYPNYGGVETVTTVLANRFASDGHNVTIASIEQPHMELQYKLRPEIEILKLDYPVNSSQNIKKLRHVLIEKKIDLIRCGSLVTSITRFPIRQLQYQRH